MHLPKEKFVVVSNIPYSITTPIMKKLLNRPQSSFQRGVIIMEKGAAKRFTSQMIKSPYIIAWRMWFDIQYIKGISRQNFSPPPKVDSAILKIQRKTSPSVPVKNDLNFWGLAAYVLKDPFLPIEVALRGVFTPSQITHLKSRLQIQTGMPVARLSEQQWTMIFETMVKHVPTYR